jgi:hypothetical protein
MKDNDEPPLHPNYRCHLIVQTLWFEREIQRLLEQHVGNTTPLILNFTPEPIGILNWSPP